MLANPELRRHLTQRDTEILLALDHCPLTATQLLKLSETFEQQRFTSVRSVQDRLQKLRHVDWVRSWPYAMATRGATPEYYKLTLLGYRILYGQSAQPTTKRYFNEVSIANHHHTRCLADFIVHTLVTAHRAAIRMNKFRRDIVLSLQVGSESLIPDCAFELHTADGQQFNFLVELDNSTERIHSEKDVESWQRKIRLYEQFQDGNYPHRFRVLAVTTRSHHRLHHILAMARERARNPRRLLVYAVHLDDYLADPNAILTHGFYNHHGCRVALVPTAPFVSSPPMFPNQGFPSTVSSATVPHQPLSSFPPPRGAPSRVLPTPPSQALGSHV